jgi:tryptophan-rich sensory protein
MSTNESYSNKSQSNSNPSKSVADAVWTIINIEFFISEGRVYPADKSNDAINQPKHNERE